MKITYEQIKAIDPRYSSKGGGMEITDFIRKYRNKVKEKTDILWWLIKDEFMSDKEQRLFAVWCARRVQHTMNEESIRLLDVAERYANGEGNEAELDHLLAIYFDDPERVSFPAFAAADGDAVITAISTADAERDAQIDRLIEIFEGRGEK